MNAFYKMPGLRANVTPYAATLHGAGPALMGYAYYLGSWGHGNRAARRIAPSIVEDKARGTFTFPAWEAADVATRMSNRHLIPALRRALARRATPDLVLP